MAAREFLAETLEILLREQIPNLFRLYLNPYVTQTCWCLERYVQTTWRADGSFQSFLANSFYEALSGAVKLARYTARLADKSATGWIVDNCQRLGSFASVTVRGQRIDFLPGLKVVDMLDEASEALPGFVVLTSPDGPRADETRRWALTNSVLLILCVDRTGLSNLRRQGGTEALPAPNIVVFDESFVDHDVPFAAFTADARLFEPWNHGARSTFHSTTFQPNSISTLHFIRCLERADPEFHGAVAADLNRLSADLAFRSTNFRRQFSPSVAKAIRLTGFDTDVRAQGAFVTVNGRHVFDAIAGVACSIRGHNPPDYGEEMEALAEVDCEAETAARLRQLTGLDHVLPAVSGASAVESALKVALAAQFPKRHVLALKSGFGGKTLLALTGTWNAAYKENLDPLYPDVSYVDPFAADAIDQIDAMLAQKSVAVVQMELVQAVGGVRRVPDAVVRHLDASRAKHDYLLLIDEVQTGMFRTGSFLLSQALNIRPDLLIVGKAISDMMFPFALTLFSDRVHDKLALAGSDLAAEIRGRHDYPAGYRTALNALRFADRVGLAERVTWAGELCKELLNKELDSCAAVGDVRVFGLLIGIELKAARWPQRWFGKRLYQFYLSALLKNASFPLLVGFCQYEPNVLKLTPPLTVAEPEIRQMCAAIGKTLRRPFWRIVGSTVAGLLNPFRHWRIKRGRSAFRQPESNGSKLATPDRKAHAPIAR
jgi:acetylornithine/succinyldiaminopimelate/putrescine aminotransferase